MDAREYHDRTKHTPLSVRSAGQALDWYNQPLPFKYYPDLEPIELPLDLPESEAAAAAVLSGAPAAGGVSVDVRQLARLLFFSAGVTRRVGWGSGMRFFRAAPSAGALYPVEVYVVCGELEGLPAGVYHFGPIDFALRRLRTGDHRGALARAAADAAVGSRPVTLVLTGIPWRTTWKYRERGYRHLFWDAGTILANTLAVAESGALAPRILGGFIDAAVAAVVDVAPPDEVPLALVTLGESTAAPATTAERVPDSLDLAVVPLSPRPLRYGAIEAVHSAGELTDAAAVDAWRAASRCDQTPATPGSRSEEPPAAERTIEDIILRRGSTRRFARDPVPGSFLRWALDVADRPVERDWAPRSPSLVRSLVAVHAADGIDPGAYAWSDGELARLHGEVSRDRTAFLCLEQALGGDSAATIFHVSDLRRVLDALGDRGYRVAQLDAGIACGRLHLAAYAAGLGATGLTFYDDEVRNEFRTDDEPMLVTAIGRPAYRSRPGRRPSEVPPVRLAPRP